MYCIKCGVELADSEKVCPLCGTRVFHPDLPQAQGEPPYPPQAQARPEEVSHTGALFVLTVPTYLPNLMLNYALKSVPATVSSIYTYLQPVLAIAISVGMGLDKLHADTVVFALVIFVGVGLVLRSYSVPPRHPDPPAAPPH